MVPKRWIIRLCLGLKHLMAASMAFPTYKQKYIERYIDRPGTDPGELRAHLELPAYRKYRYMMIAMALIYYLRGIIYPTVVFQFVDSINLASNVRVHHHEQQNVSSISKQGNQGAAVTYSFLCLSTNCSRLSLPYDNLDISLSQYLGLIGSSSPADDLGHPRSSPPFLSTMAASEPGHHLQEYDAETSTTTDVSELVLAQLGEDFYRLPFFTLCHPKLSLFHDQLQYLQLLGMLTASILSVGVLLVGAFIPVLQWARPAAAPVLMFILAPRVNRRTMFLRLRDISMEIKSSCHNYRLALVTGGLVGDTHNHMGCSGRASSVRSRGSTLICYGPQLERQFDRLKLNRFVSDCLPSIKTDWWRHKIAHSLIATSAVCLAAYTFGYLTHYSMCHYFIHLRRNYLQTLALHLRNQQNCSLWYTPATDDHNNQLAPIDLGKAIPAGVNWLHLVQFLSHVWPVSCMALLCSLYYATNADLFCYLSEIRFQLQVSIQYARLVSVWRRRRRRRWHSHHHPPEKLEFGCLDNGMAPKWMQQAGPMFASSSSLSPSGVPVVWDPNLICCGLFRMEPIRQRFRMMTDINMLVLSSNLMIDSDGARKINSRLKSQLAMERFVAETMDFSTRSPRGAGGAHGACTTTSSSSSTSTTSASSSADGQLEMLEKLYVTFRGFVEHMRDCAPSAGHMMLVANLFNYSVLSTCVVYVRYVRNFLAEPLLVVVAIWTLCSFFVLVPSNLHAKARKLEQLIWSLLAETTATSQGGGEDQDHEDGDDHDHDHDDVRLEHMRLLWLKQLDMITSEGGLALSFLSIRITYVNIIQMLIWTATIFVLAMRL